MRIGKLMMSAEYFVDLDNDQMVQLAKNALVEDVYNAVKYEEVENWIGFIETPDATEQDIPSWLMENEMEDE